MTEMTYVRACELVIKECPDGYAKAYAKAGLDLPYEGPQLAEAKRVQALYILNNMTRWTGLNATQVRNYLKKFSKGYTD